MSTNLVSISIILVPIACIAIAAWPLLLSRWLRPMVLGAAGSSCVGLGGTIVALLAGGVLQLPVIASRAVAEDAVPDRAGTELTVEAAAEPKAASTHDPVIESRDTVEIPPGRPEWVGKEPDTSSKVHKIAVSSGPYALDSQSRKALDEALVKATTQYIAEHVGSELAPKFLRYDARAIRKEFVKQENLYHDVARYPEPVGWMHENFALLEFTPEFRRDLDRRWEKVRATSRLTQTGLISGAALLMLSSIFGYFRLDNATRGYYSGRLQFMAGAAILAVIGGGAVLAQWIHWL